MENKTFNYLALIFFLFTITGCEIIGDIFQTGVGVGVILVVLIIILGLYLFNKMRGSR